MGKNLLIKKFQVRYAGKRWGAGDIIANVPGDIADKLVAENPGLIVEIVLAEAAQVSVEAPAAVSPERENEVVIEEAAEGTAALPDIDPKTTVAARKTKRS